MSNNPAGSRLTHRLAWLYFIAVMLAYAVVILSANTPPHFVDYPDWVYQGVLFRAVTTGHPFPGYALKPYPVPNSLTTVGIGLLSTVFSWQLAAKLWICLYLILAAVATFLLARTLGSVHSRTIVALPAILFLNLDLWYGHISFEIGMCLFMILVALVLRGASSVSLTLLMVLLFFAHMEALACALLFIALWAALTRQYRRLWTTAPALVLTLWYAAARFAYGNADAGAAPTAAYLYGSKRFLVYKANTFFKAFGYVNARSLSGLSLSEAVFGRPLFLALAALSLVLAALVLFLVFRAVLFGREHNPPYIRAFVLALAAVSLLLPQVVLGTADPGSRLLLTAAAIGLLVAEWRTRAGLAVASLSVIFCVANLWQFARIQHNPALTPHQADLPAAVLLYGHVEPSMRDSWYEHLSTGQMDAYIFPTAMFLRR